MSTNLAKIAADFLTQLAEKNTIGQTTSSLQSATDDDSVALASGTWGFTVDGNNSQKEYFLATLSGTSLTNIRSVSRQGVITTGFAREHRVGAQVKITDFANLLMLVRLFNGTDKLDATTPFEYDASFTPTLPNQVTTKGYVDSVVAAGAADASTTAIGIVRLSTAPSNTLGNPTITIASPAVITLNSHGLIAGDRVQFTTSGSLPTGINSGNTYYVISAGLTSNSFQISGTLNGSAINTSGSQGGTHTLIQVTPYAVGTNDTRIPTQAENDALVGTSGAPSSSNKYITDDDASTGYDQQQTTQNATRAVGEADATTKNNKLAQSFVAGKTNLAGAKLYKSADTGSFTGTVTISLQADSSGSPSGSALATVTLSNAAWLALPTGAFHAMFGTPYTSAVIGTTYWIVIETSTSDNSNHPNLGTNSAGGYASGSVKMKNTTDGWTAVSTIDLYFSVLTTIGGKIIRTDSNGFTTAHIYYGVDTGGDDTYSLEIPGVTSLVEGMSWLVKFTTANTGAATLNINSTGANALKKHKDVALNTGDIKAGQTYIVLWNGTNFELIGMLGTPVTSFVGALTTHTAEATTVNRDTTFTTNFRPSVIEIMYQINTAGASNDCVGIARFDSSGTLIANMRFGGNAASTTAVLISNITVDATGATASGGGASSCTISINSIADDSFVVRCAIVGSGSNEVTVSYHPMAFK